MRKLISLFTLALLIVVGTTSNRTRTVSAAPIDCDAIAALCRIASRIDYDICILKGGDPSDCAWAEANQTINCIRGAGCNPIPRGPGDN